MQTELTAEQLAQAEQLSLDELRALAVKELSGELSVPEKKKETLRDDKGRFTAPADDLIVNGEEDPEKPHTKQIVEEDPGPEITIYRKEIDNADGSGVDVYEAESLEELVDKIAEGKKNANKKIRELNAQVKAKAAAEQQTEEDVEYVVAEKLKKNPKQTIKEVVTETIAEQQEAIARSNRVQEHFVATHPDYKKVPENGQKITDWVKLHGYTEFTLDNLEKAYQDLKKSGLLILEAAGADDATDVDTTTQQRTAEEVENTTQQRSQRGSTISSSRRVSTSRVNTQPTEDEAYTMPLDKLKALADKQLASRFSQ